MPCASLQVAQAQWQGEAGPPGRGAPAQAQLNGAGCQAPTTVGLGLPVLPLGGPGDLEFPPHLLSLSLGLCKPMKMQP